MISTHRKWAPAAPRRNSVENRICAAHLQSINVLTHCWFFNLLLFFLVPTIWNDAAVCLRTGFLRHRSVPGVFVHCFNSIRLIGPIQIHRRHTTGHSVYAFNKSGVRHTMPNRVSVWGQCKMEISLLNAERWAGVLYTTTAGKDGNTVWSAVLCLCGAHLCGGTRKPFSNFAIKNAINPSFLDLDIYWRDGVYFLFVSPPPFPLAECCQCFNFVLGSRPLASSFVLLLLFHFFGAESLSAGVCTAVCACVCVCV